VRLLSFSPLSCLLDKGNKKIVKMDTPFKENLKLLVQSYEQRIFALVLYLAGNNRDKAYDIAVSSVVEVLRIAPFLRKEDFLASLAKEAIEKSRDAKIIPTSDESDFMDFPPEKRKLLLIIRTALQALPFDEKVMLLLRDQLHLPYKNIAAVLQLSESNVRTQIIHARIHLREKNEEVLRDAG
jgi:DNA-directed RNA polymerase specialized sigma24 family protein